MGSLSLPGHPCLLACFTTIYSTKFDVIVKSMAAVCTGLLLVKIICILRMVEDTGLFTWG